MSEWVTEWREAREAAEGGYRTKNKNPTRQCGEKFDQGGNGDCFFRALSIFDLSPAALAQSPTEDQSKNSGAWLRSQAVLHAQKHADRFGKLFPSKAEFDAWLKDNAQPMHWCNGPIAQATAEKLVGPLLFGGKRKMCGSDMSSQAASARGMPVSTRRSLLLFSSLLTATMWLWFLLKVNLFLHLGSKKLWTSSSTFLVLDGPILQKLYSFGSYCVFCKCFLSFVSTERKHHDLQSEGTPSVHTLSELVSSHVRTGRSVQPEAAASPRRQRLIRIWGQKQRNNTIAENERQWTCPHCAVVTATSGPALSRAHSNHLSSRHPGVHTPKIFSVRANVADHVDASAAVPLEENAAGLVLSASVVSLLVSTITSRNLRSLGTMLKNILIRTLVLLPCMLFVLNNTVSLRIFNLISNKVKLVFLLNFLVKPIPFLSTLATILW